MKIESSFIQNAYPQTNEIPKLKKADKDIPSSSEKKNAANSMDPIELSTGMDIQKIQQILTTEIGKKVDKMISDAGIDITAAAGLDWSPEAVSGRIFDMTTSMFGIFRGQQSKMSEIELIDSFEKVLRNSVNQGYKEASAVIASNGLGEQASEIGSRTMELLHERYDAYFKYLRSTLESKADEAMPTQPA
jgi:hypothetical protein